MQFCYSAEHAAMWKGQVSKFGYHENRNKNGTPTFSNEEASKKIVGTFRKKNIFFVSVLSTDKWLCEGETSRYYTF